MTENQHFHLKSSHVLSFKEPFHGAGRSRGALSEELACSVAVSHANAIHL